jgi:hypothetical protein
MYEEKRDLGADVEQFLCTRNILNFPRGASIPSGKRTRELTGTKGNV